MTYYLVRRHLGYSPREWDQLAWWQQQLYLEGLEEEGLIETVAGSADPSLVDQQVSHSGSTTIVDQQFHSDFSGQPGEMAAFGIRERTL